MFVKDEQGQTLVIIVMVMILALGIGITAASRYISTLHADVNVDNQYRADAVAQAAIERILLLDTSTLASYIQAGTCGSDCVLEIVGEDGVVATANVTLSHVGGTSDNVDISIPMGDVVEVNMLGYGNNDISVCWENTNSSYPSIVALFVYGTQGSYQSEAYAINTIGSPYASNHFDTAVSAHGYSNCFTATGEDNPQLLRLHALYSEVNAVLVPAVSAEIPEQGILVTSVGEVLDSVRTVSVVVSDSILPLEFDYTLFSTSESDDLTNKLP